MLVFNMFFNEKKNIDKKPLYNLCVAEIKETVQWSEKRHMT